MSDVLIRPMRESDLPELQKLSPPHLKPFVHFLVYVTLVAEVEGKVAGYTQFSLSPDGTLHSLAIRVGQDWMGRGIGQQLMEEKVALAKDAGAKRHIYAVDTEGKESLKAILIKQGMHLCHSQAGVTLYVASLTTEDDGGH